MTAPRKPTGSAPKSAPKSAVKFAPGSGPRVAISRRAAAALAATPEPPPPPAIDVGPSGWTAAHDGQIMATKGRYAALSRLATAWGLPVRAVLSRWHRLRAAR